MNPFPRFISSRPSSWWRCTALLGVLMIVAAAECVAEVRLREYRVSLGQALLPVIEWKGAETEILPTHYRLRAKLITPSYEFQLADQRHNSGQSLDSFPSGLVIGSSYQVQLYVIQYSNAECTADAVQWSPTYTREIKVVQTNVVLLTNETTTMAPLPVIVTTEPMVTPETPTSPSVPVVYRLRSKVNAVPGFSDGFHAASSWSNNNYHLDQVPPPGTYLNQLYWVKYSLNTAGILVPQSISTFLDATLKVSQGSVALSSYYFKPTEPPAIISDEPMPENYRLRARFSGTPTAGSSGTITDFQATTTGNNTGFLLDRLPPPGVYDVDLYWEKLDTAGNLLTAGTGPVFQKIVTIYEGEPSHLDFTGGGTITEGTYTDDDGVEQTYYEGGQSFPVYLPGNGIFHVSTTGLVDTYCQLIGPTGSFIISAENGGTGLNFSLTTSVSAAGWYSLYVGGSSAGSYVLAGTFDASDGTGGISVPTVTGATQTGTGSFTANWGMVAGATSYFLDVTTSSGFFPGNFVPGYQNRQLGPSNAQAVVGLSPATTYYYRVRASKVNTTSADSAVAQTATAPNVPGSQSAVDITSTGFTASWAQTPGALQYAVSYSTSPDFPVAITTTLLVDNPAATPSTSKPIPAGLTPNTTYYFQVAAVGQFGGTIWLPRQLAIQQFFKTQAPKPVQLALQSWVANDRPDIVVSEYALVWVEESGGGWGCDISIDENYDWSTWDGGMSDLSDPDGNYCGSIPSFFSVSWHQDDPTPAHWADSWTDVSYPDGISGSSWATTRGSFPKNDPVSGYNPGTKDRLYLLPSYRPGEAITFRAWNVVPDANAIPARLNSMVRASLGFCRPRFTPVPFSPQEIAGNAVLSPRGQASTSSILAISTRPTPRPLAGPSLT